MGFNKALFQPFRGKNTDITTSPYIVIATRFNLLGKPDKEVLVAGFSDMAEAFNCLSLIRTAKPEHEPRLWINVTQETATQESNG